MAIAPRKSLRGNYDNRIADV